MPVEDEVIQIGGLLVVSRRSPKSSRMSRSGVRKDRKVLSTELSTLAWDMALKKLSAWVKRAKPLTAADRKKIRATA